MSQRHMGFMYKSNEITIQYIKNKHQKLQEHTALATTHSTGAYSYSHITKHEYSLKFNWTR